TPSGLFSRLLVPRLPEPPVVAEIPPLLGGTPVDLLTELDARGLLQIAGQGLREDLRELLGIPPADVLDVPHGVGLSQQGVAVAAGVEDLAVDVGGGVARQVDDDRRDVIRIAVGAGGPLARPFARLLEDRPARGVEWIMRVAPLGMIAFTVTPYLAIAFAVDQVSPMIPAFAAA